MGTLKLSAFVVVIVFACGVCGAVEPTTRPSLKESLAQLKVPPDWFDAITAHWDVNRPWAEARLEVRRLLGGNAEQVREAVKITWLYAQKKDIGNGHELPMYLFMSGNYAWAAAEYATRMKSIVGTGATHEYLCYVSCLAHFGEYEQALAVLEQASKELPKPPWLISNQAGIQNAYGDVYAQMGDIARAKRAYGEAMRLYPLSDQPYGRHLLQRYVAKIKNKLDLLAMDSLAKARLRDGTYVGTALGYADTKDMQITVIIKGGRMADIKVAHQEKIELGATVSIPAKIIEKQSLKVDAVTGATVTSQAIIDGTLAALRKAGLR